jgi:hypothetical protein
MAIETKDLWLAAFLVANGGELKEVRPVRGGEGQRVPVFVVEGEGMDYLTSHYADGNIMGNLTRQRRSVEHLEMRARRRLEEVDHG